jgi:hypothetical protein
MKDLVTTLAKAIRAADSSYFSEDYEKQARAVLKAIESAGFALTPKEAPADIYTKVAEIMPTGRMRPDELVKRIYTITVDQMRANVKD